MSFKVVMTVFPQNTIFLGHSVQAGATVWPYDTHAQDLVVPAPLPALVYGLDIIVIALLIYFCKSVVPSSAAGNLP